MLVLRIIATIFIALSVLTAVLKNARVSIESENQTLYFIVTTSYSALWRAFVIVALWLI